MSGVLSPLPERWAQNAGDTGEAEAALAREIGDITLIRVDFDWDTPRTVRVWKGLTSAYDVFIARRADGALVLADHFRNALAHLAPSERTPGEDAIIDHLLFRHVPGRNTYARAVTRPAHGTCLTIDLETDTRTETRFDRGVSSSEIRSQEEWTAGIDQAMRKVTGELERIPGIVTMLSGGIDSSLIQTYFGDRVPALTVASEGDFAHFGGTRAHHVAELLHTKIRTLKVSGADFLSHLEEAIDSRGLPPHFPQWVTLTKAFSGPDAAYVIGERAGCLFTRVGGRVPTIAKHFVGPLGRAAIPLVDFASLFLKKRGFQLLPAQVRSMQNDPLDPRGWPSLVTTNTLLSFVDRKFGRERVDARLASRLSYVAGNIDLLDRSADRYVRNLELAHWFTFHNDHVMLFRHLAHAYGKSLHAPFGTRPLMSSALAVPPTHRHEKDGIAKYLLKDLLSERLPGYGQTKTKDFVSVDLATLYRDGPLADVWERYAIPEFFTAEERGRVVEKMTQVTWNAIAYAIWRKRIADNPALTPHRQSIVREWRAGNDADERATAMAGRWHD
ncbi:MAG: hypothetical protein GC199_07395 [Alphaproteobacteria bacterium]|nr:hypothetical protein [Alphaproteobacteria bacterium]